MEGSRGGLLLEGAPSIHDVERLALRVVTATRPAPGAGFGFEVEHTAELLVLCRRRRPLSLLIGQRDG